MKALDILESLQIAIFDANIKNTSVKFLNTHVEDIQEAIAELEELIKPRSCDSCDSIFYDEIESCYKCLNNISDDVTFLHGEAVIRDPDIFSCRYYYNLKDKQ